MINILIAINKREIVTYYFYDIQSDNRLAMNGINMRDTDK